MSMRKKPLRFEHKGGTYSGRDEARNDEVCGGQAEDGRRAETLGNVVCLAVIIITLAGGVDFGRGSLHKF